MSWVSEKFAHQKKERQDREILALGAKQVSSAWNAASRAESILRYPAPHRKTFPAMTRYRTLGRFQLRAEKLRLTPAFHGVKKRGFRIRPDFFLPDLICRA